MEFEYPPRKTLDDKEMFDDIVNGILSVLGDDVVKIILYGSVARGDNTWESDVDIAVLTKKYYDWKARKELYEALWEYDLKHDTIFSIVPIAEASFYGLMNEKLFYRNIAKDGITLWTRKAA